MGAPTITTRLNPSRPLCFARRRDGVLLAVDGLDRGFVWDGQTTSAEQLGVDAPTVAPTITPTAAGTSVTAGDYSFGYRYIDDTLPTPYPSNLTRGAAVVTAAGGDKFVWSVTAPSTTVTAGQPTVRAKLVELWRTTSDQNRVYYLVATLGAYGSLTSVDNNGGFVRFTIPIGHGLIVGAKFLASFVPVLGYNTTHIVTAVTATTVTTDQVWTSNTSGGQWVITGFQSDTLDDTALAANEELPDFEDDGSPSSQAYTPPPNYMGVVIVQQDRALYMAPVSYSTGTVATTASGTTLTGTGTTWTPGMVGRYVYIDGEPAPLVISAYSSATSLTLSSSTPATLTQSGKTYAIAPDPLNNNQIRYSQENEFEAVPPTNIIDLQENVDDHDKIIGAVARGAYSLIFKERHIYNLSFERQPDIDAKPVLIAERGALNFRTIVAYEGIVYAMDARGIYAVTSEGIKELGDKIRDVLIFGLDMTKSQWFHAAVDQQLRLVKFFVSYTGDGTTRPRRALCFHPDTQTWWPEQFPVEIGGACNTSIAGQESHLIGGENDLVLKKNTGHTDIVATAIRGTATASGNTTLTDSGASFTDAVLDAPVAIVAGTGKGQIRRISARTSTQLTVTSAWTTNPSTDSVYVVGAIEYSAQFGRMRFATDAEVQAAREENARSVRITIKPTTNNASLDVRLYFNEESAPRVNAIAVNQGSGYVTELGSADATIDLKKTRSSLADAIGFYQFAYSGRIDDRNAFADREMAVELRGFQTEDRIFVYGLTVFGVR